MKSPESQTDRFKKTGECGQSAKESQETEDFSRTDGIIGSLVGFVEPFLQLAAVGGLYGR
jgi:hypothetical protein